MKNIDTDQVLEEEALADLEIVHHHKRNNIIDKGWFLLKIYLKDDFLYLNFFKNFRLNRSGSGSSISSISDYEYRTQCVTERPLVRVPRDVIRAPTPPPVIQRVVERAPTPEPDVVERVIVRPQPQQLIERIIERPRTPPPKIIDKEICEPAPPPIVRTRWIILYIFQDKKWRSN